MPKIAAKEESQSDDPIFSSLRDGNFDKVLSWVREVGEQENYESVWNKRDVVGAGILHICFLFQRIKVAKEIHAIMAEKNVNLLNEPYTGPIFAGETCLHIAIVNNDKDAVRFCLENGCEAKAQATGAFFSMGGDAYFGQFPYSFAAYYGRVELLQILFETDPESPYRQDAYGNTALHVAILGKQWGAFRYIVETHMAEGRDLRLVPNFNGLTPFLMACERRDAETFAKILEMRREVVWKYGHLTRYAYDLTELDTFVAQQNEISGKGSMIAGLQLIVSGNSENVKDILNHPVISRILEHKWETFARRVFLRQAFLFLCHLVLLLVAILLRPNESLADRTELDDVQSARFVCELAVLSTSLLYTLTDFATVRQQGGFRRFFDGDSGLSIFFQLTRWLHFLSIFFAAGFRIGGVDLEHIAVTLAPITGWIYILFFARASKTLGIVVCTVFQMVTRDVRTWITMLVCVVLGFAQGTFVLLRAGSPAGFIATVFSNIQGSLGSTNFDGGFEHTTGWLIPMYSILLVVYFFTVSVLLINLLIAMMGNTFQDILGDSMTQWQKSKAEVTLEMEKTLGEKERVKTRCGVLEKAGKLKGVFALEITTPAAVLTAQDPAGELDVSKGPSLNLNRKIKFDDESGDGGSVGRDLGHEFATIRAKNEYLERNLKHTRGETPRDHPHIDARPKDISSPSPYPNTLRVSAHAPITLRPLKPEDLPPYRKPLKALPGARRPNLNLN